MITKFSPNQLEPLTFLLETSFKISNEDKSSLVNWKYFDPYLQGKTITYVATDDHEKIISHYTNIPVTIENSNESFKAMICTDMCTDPHFRGQGLISKLSAKVYQDVRQEKYDFSLGYSNDQGIQVDKHSDNYGYLIVGKFVRYFKFVLFKNNTQYQLRKAAQIDQRFIHEVSPYFKIVKDYDYLDWRYIRKPNAEYVVYELLDNNKLLGYVVVRFLKYKCYVYDIVLNRIDLVSEAAKAIENLAIARKAKIVIYNVLDNKYWQKFFKYLYFKKSNNHTNYYLTIKFHNEKLSKDRLLDKNHWLLMNGDIL